MRLVGSSSSSSRSHTELGGGVEQVRVEAGVVVVRRVVQADRSQMNSSLKRQRNLDFYCRTARNRWKMPNSGPLVCRCESEPGWESAVGVCIRVLIRIVGAARCAGRIRRAARPTAALRASHASTVERRGRCGQLDPRRRSGRVTRLQ